MNDSRFTITLLSLTLLLACETATPPGGAEQPPVLSEFGVQFSDVTEEAGIDFRHNSGRAGAKWLPETMGPGVAFIDADGDGWLDVLIVNGKDWKASGRRSTAKLYRNKQDGTFEDITAGSGLDFEAYSIGVTVGDYDNDGRDDIYITTLGQDRLLHNEGGGKFADVTAASGINNDAFGTSAAWLDFDLDGRLDLFVANYVQWSPEKDLFCSLDGAVKSYCTPESYPGSSSKLYRNLGDGKFSDVTDQAGLGDPTSKSLGLVAFDYDNDGWTDLFVANDTQPNKLYRNLQNGKFEEIGVASGVAFGEDGVARGAMGVDAIDYDRSGRPSLITGNFSNEMLGLYHNEGNSLFVDEAPRSAVGRASLLSLTFGLFFFDADLDGYPDIFAANGHIDEEIERVQPKVTFKQAPLLLRNLGAGKFQPVDVISAKMVARGAAYGDYDKDGDLDILIAENHGPARLFRNDRQNANHWLSVRLEGVTCNRNGIGAAVRLTSAGGTQSQTVHSGSSYCSASDLALTFGLGGDDMATKIEIDWPGGKTQTLTDVAANQQLTLRQE